MNYLTLDYLIVYAFLAITLTIGFLYSRGIKSIREYAIGSGAYGTAVLVFTFFATNIGGASTLDAASEVFEDGIIGTMAALGVVIQVFIFIACIVPHMKYFKHCLTIGDVMGSFYGKYSQILTGLLSTLYSFCMIGMELFMLGVISETLLHIPAHWGIIFGGLLLIIYSTHGGIKSVTATDVLQFLVLFIVIPLIASIVLSRIGGITDMLTKAPVTKFNILTNEKFSFYFTLFLIWSILPLGLVSPPIFQRLLMAKSTKDLRNQFLIVAGLDPLYRITVMVIGLGGLILFPHIQAAEVMPHIIKELLPIGIKGFAVTGMLAIVMSTLDSYLHTAGLLLVHDVIQPLLQLKKININELKWAKYSTFLVGIVSIIVGLKATNVLELSFGAMRMSGPLILFPLLAGIWGLKPDKKIFYWSGGITAVVFILFTLALPQGHTHLSMPISIVVNAISFMAIHLVKNKGLAVINRNQGENPVKIWNLQRKSIWLNVKSYIPTPSNIIQYSQQRIKKYGAPYILFGAFVAINFTYPYFMWNNSMPQHYSLMLTLRFIGAFLCGLLIVKAKWPQRLLPYFSLYWHLVILYCLPFIGTLMFLLTQASVEWLINIALTLILLLIVVDWVTALILGILGILLALGFYWSLIGQIDLSLNFTSKYLLVYQGIFGLLIGLIFARRRQLRYDRLATDNQILVASEKETRQAHLETFIEKIRLIKTLKNANIQNLPIVVKGLRELRTQIKEATAASLEQTIRALESKVASVALALTSVDNRAIDYLRLETKPMTLAQLLEQLQQQLPNFTLHYIGKTQHHQVVGDPIQLVKLLKNTIVALPTPENLQQKDYYLTLEDTQLTYPLRMVSPSGDYVKPLPALRLTLSQQADHVPDLAPSYAPEMSTSALPNPTNGRELLLTENQRIIKAHYGYTNVDVSKQTAYDYYLYVIPIDVTDIRPPDMNTPDKELGVALVRANDQYPGAQEQEQAFLRDVKQKSTANLENVKEALELIKWYHGAVSRRSGEPYYLHPLAVAHIVLDWNQEEATIIGGLLHDVVEDTPMLLENIDMMFGPEVVRVVDYVTHFESFKDSFYRGKLNDIENKRMLLEATDKRALYVKIADRLHNMRTIEGHQKEEKKKKISQETLDFFVPLAKSLNLEKAAKELLDISTQVLNR